MERAKVECDSVIATVFINPLQFGDGEDFDSYPRDVDGDLRKLDSAGVDVVFVPPVEEMYPVLSPSDHSGSSHSLNSRSSSHSRISSDHPGQCAPDFSTVRVGSIAGSWEGATRPGHFEGVATIVAKLFALVGPCRAYFGEKDYQQLLVVRKMARDLLFPVEVVGCATVRDQDGLALSSRNVRLGPAERRAASVLKRSLAAAARDIERGETDPGRVALRMRELITREPLASLVYAAAVDARTLEAPERLEGEVRLIVAARIGSVRLIDNEAVRAAEPVLSLARAGAQVV
jgi:pantoate--beta-alanine ligase